MILAIVASMNLELHQMDVKIAYLNKDLKEVGFIKECQENKVCRLLKSIMT